jgi:peptidoglycan biosynthesis protein MviN/MurJ (putative lipid II flippase)
MAEERESRHEDDRRLEYFSHCDGEGPQEPVLSGGAAWAMFLALIGAAVGIAAGLSRLNPYSRPAASMVVGGAGLLAMYFAARALMRRGGGHVERSVSVLVIALSGLCVVGAILIMVRRG